ncbi:MULTISPECIES: hypothetical protein [unclassified Wolbachia]|uniref:hypothetical protein n=2 Tax=Wolbachia TaxID=953 RepID=UPI001BC08E8A|nr:MULTISPECIES: hypothetical protein [unclassified Wolbachia]MBR9983421.1 hypothetical protein [Wolbachia endosymbiont of Homalodisca vitripennis]MCJ7454648.1 hypothetical protein [Wolbachia endosymbiont of Homalodisca vitripennis]MCJ7475969.1 hypothetical protein [Wolbachia endosymbiont of Homalodisca vitripennis]
MIVHITKLKAAGLFINQRNIQFMDELVRFWRGRNNNFLQNLPRWFSKFNKEVSKLKKENSVLYTFLRESNINVLVKMWEESEYIRNKFIGRDLNKELKEILKERYSKYADILINKADDIRRKIFLHNNKLLLDPLSEHYQYSFKDMTFTDIRNFFDVHKEDFRKKSQISLIDLIDLSDVRKNTPILKVQAFVEIIRNVKPSRNLDNSNAEQLQAIDRKIP